MLLYCFIPLSGPLCKPGPQVGNNRLGINGGVVKWFPIGRHSTGRASVRSYVDQAAPQKSPWRPLSRGAEGRCRRVSPVPTWSWADVRRTAPQFCGRKFHGHGSHGCSDRWCSVRAFDVSAARRSPPRKDLAETGHALAGGFDNRTTWLQRSLQPGMTPVPITLF